MADDRTTQPDLTICMAVKNRSRFTWKGREIHLLPRCLDSLLMAQAATGLRLEVLLADDASTDWPLAEWLPGPYDGRLAIRILPVCGNSRGAANNFAVAQARSARLFIGQPDMIWCPQVLRRAVEVIDAGRFYIPYYQRFHRESETAWIWGVGSGNMALSRALYDAVGGWPVIPGVGADDTWMMRKLERRAAMVRERVLGFQHIWHPSDAELAMVGQASRLSGTTTGGTPVPPAATGDSP